MNNWEKVYAKQIKFGDAIANRGSTKIVEEKIPYNGTADTHSVEYVILVFDENTRRKERIVISGTEKVDRKII